MSHNLKNAAEMNTMSDSAMRDTKEGGARQTAAGGARCLSSRPGAARRYGCGHAREAKTHPRMPVRHTRGAEPSATSATAHLALAQRSRQTGSGGGQGRVLDKKNPVSVHDTGLWEKIPATSYSPTRLPVQYHWLRRA